MRQGFGLWRQVVAAGISAGLGLGAAACGEVSTDPDAGDEESEADASGQAGGDDAGAAPDAAHAECDEGFTGPDCEDCTVFVDGDEGSDSNQGLSWDDAVASVNAGIGRAATRLENDDLERCAVWVREGTYVPGESRDDSFELASGVHVFGGFAGFESAREDRNFDQYETTLSGDINDSGDLDGNAYHVVTASDIGPDDATLDGFTITAGNADGEISEGQHRGGGMGNVDASPALENIAFAENQADMNGGAMYNAGDSTPTLKDVSFVDNQAGRGGAIYNAGGAPMLTRVSFTDNQASSSGGAMYNTGSATLTNVSFINNRASNNGGAIQSISNATLTLTNVLLAENRVDSAGGAIHHNSSGSLDLKNVTLAENFAEGTRFGAGGGALRLSDADAEVIIQNSIVWGNESDEGEDEIDHALGSISIAETIVQDMAADDFDGDGEVDVEFDTDNPNFVDATDGDLRLQSGSPAIDAGDTSVTNDPGFPEIDLAGNPRVVGDEIDLGAYEYQP